MILLLSAMVFLEVAAIVAIAMCLIDTSRILNQQAEIVKQLHLEVSLIQGPQFADPNKPAPENESVFVAPDEARFFTDNYLAAAADVELEEEKR